MSLEKALSGRRSVRSYSGRSLSLQEVSQLLWAAQGKTDRRGLRTAPSAGALYPLEVYLAVAEVSGLSAGVYRYLPEEHVLSRVSDGHRSEDLRRAALNQQAIAEAAVVVVMAAVYERTMGKYGDRGIRYAAIEVGHAAQNLLLQAEALGLGAVPIGAFNDRSVGDIVGGRSEERPLYLIPVGAVRK
jgi:SagB-type dehydrogenase family enzyme